MTQFRTCFCFFALVIALCNGTPSVPPLYFSDEFGSKVASAFRGTTGFEKRIYFGGGHDGSKFLDLVDIFTVPDRTWTNATFGSGQAREAAAGAAGGYVLFGGGACSTGDDCTLTYSSAVDIFHVESGTWLAKQTLPLGGRKEISGAGLGRKIFFAGGRYGNAKTESIAAVDIFDVVDQAWKNPSELFPSGKMRYGIPIATLGDLVVFGGGRTGYASGGYDEVNAVDGYDVDSESWVMNESFPSGACHYGGAGVGAGELVVFAAGAGGTGQEVDIFNVKSLQWSVSSMATAVQHCYISAFVLSERWMYFTGGACPSKIDVYDSRSNAWVTHWPPTETGKVLQGMSGFGVLNTGIVCGGVGSAHCDVYMDFNAEIEQVSSEMVILQGNVTELRAELDNCEKSLQQASGSAAVPWRYMLVLVLTVLC